MKKIFTLLAFAAAAFTVNAQEQYGLNFGSSWNCTAAFDEVTISFSDQWGEYKLIGSEDMSDVVGFTVTYSNASSGVQLKYMDTDEGEYYLELPSTETSVTKTDLTITLASLNVQAKTADGEYVTIEKVTYIKSDESTFDSEGYGGVYWGCSVAPIESADITFTGQYGSVEIVSLAGESITYTPSETTSVEIVITLSEAGEQYFTVEVDKYDEESSANTYLTSTTCAAGETSCTITLDNTLSAAVTAVYLKTYLDADFPTVKVKSIMVTTKSTGTAVSAISADEITDGPAYNLAGQVVDENYKGIVIKNGKKYLQK